MCVRVTCTCVVCECATNAHCLCVCVKHKGPQTHSHNEVGEIDVKTLLPVCSFPVQRKRTVIGWRCCSIFDNDSELVFKCVRVYLMVKCQMLISVNDESRNDVAL